MSLFWANHFNVIILVTHRNEPCPVVNIYSACKAVDCLLPTGQTIWTSSICISKDFWKRHFKGTSSMIPFVFLARLITKPTYSLPSLGLMYINKLFLSGLAWCLTQRIFFALHWGRKSHCDIQPDCFYICTIAWRCNDVWRKMCWKMSWNIST